MNVGYLLWELISHIMRAGGIFQQEADLDPQSTNSVISRKLFLVSLLVTLLIVGDIVVVSLLENPGGMTIDFLWLQYLMGEFTSTTALSYTVTGLLLAGILYLTKDMPRGWKKAFLRNGLAALLLTPAIFMDPAMVVAEYVPAGVPVFYCGIYFPVVTFMNLLSIANFGFLPILIVLAVLTFIAAIRSRKQDPGKS